jgi:hypothetical protein
MHDQPTNGRGLSLAEVDDQMQGVVLTHLLDDYPASFTTEEVVSELLSDDPRFGDRDVIVRAVRDLQRAGLLHRRDEFVFPTRAAARFRSIRVD